MPDVPKGQMHLTAALVGASVGFLCLTIAANLGEWSFYTLRSLVTGRTAMSEIVYHPADTFVVPLLLVVFVGGGAMSGVWLRKRFVSRSETRHPTDHGAR